MQSFHYTILYNLFLHPKEAFREIIREKPWWLLVFLFIGARLSKTVGKGVVFSGTGFWGKALLFFGLSGEILIVLILWIVCTCIFHFSAQLLGGNGEGKDLFLSFGFTSFPFIFLVPLSLITTAWVRGGWVLWITSSFFIYIWAFILKLIAIEEVYQFNCEKAFIVMLLPLVVLSGLLFLVPIISIIQFLIFGLF